MSFLLDLPVLLALGVLVRWLAHRIFRDNPWGILPAQALAWAVGFVLTGAFLVASLGLYLDVWPFGPYRGSDWQLNSGLPFGIRRGFWVDIVAALLFLLYPVAYVVGVALAESVGAFGSPAIREPIRLRGGSLIAIADTHLGLAPNAIQRRLFGGMEATPLLVMQFLRWLAAGSLGEVPVWIPPTHQGKGTVDKRTLRSPAHLLLCGDIVEMWDAPDESMQLAMAMVVPALRDIPTESVYVVGNHDSLLARDRTTGTAGAGEIQIVPEVWPGPDPGDPLDPTGRGLRPILVGDRQYLFLHGHQFDRGFQAWGPLSLVPGHLRRAARFGLYAWLFGIPLLAVALLLLFALPGTGALAGVVAAALALLVVPPFYMAFSRLIWFVTRARYNEKLAIEGFRRWWKVRAGGGRARRGIAAGHDDLAIVYGHTHMADIIDLRATMDGGRKVGLPLLLNVPSWVVDPGREQERSIFLYIDEKGPLFLGWDWRAKKPFHIPDALLVARRRDTRPPFVDELTNVGMTADDLRDLDWPVGFQEKWARVDVGGLAP